MIASGKRAPLAARTLGQVGARDWRPNRIHPLVVGRALLRNSTLRFGQITVPINQPASWSRRETERIDAIGSGRIRGKRD